MKRLLLVICVLMLLAADMPPQLPSSFYGTVTGYPAGAKINAFVDNTRVAQVTAFSYPGYGVVYTVNVPGDALDEGKAIVFKTGSVIIGRGVWHSGTNVELNLSAPVKRKR
jgi:hypothetical protein